MEALHGIPDSLDERVHALQATQSMLVASNLRRLLSGSDLVYGRTHPRIQDAYSLRCIPQVHRATRDAYSYVEQVINTEINSVTDNICSLRMVQVISAGSFHGQPVAALDFLGIALAGWEHL